MKALVLLSGGVDSATCLGLAVQKYGAAEVFALSVYYGQTHSKELDAAQKVADYYGVVLKRIDLSVIFEGSDCSLLAKSHNDIPLQSYAEQLSVTDGKPVSTYVPFRNGLFELGVPYKYTWSCYSGGVKPCGVCATCRDRAAAFEANGIQDPSIKGE